MKKKQNKLVGGGGNSLKSSHIKRFELIKALNNLAPWGENKFVSEQERTYKFKRGVNNILDCHAIARNDEKNLCHPELGATHVAHWNNSRKIAFTLAEVLITLGIIGVVAAMTMPSLITNYRVKETVSKLKKVNTTFNNALLAAKEENGEISDWGLTNSTLDTDTDNGSIANSNSGRDKFLEILSKHLKTVSICKYSDNSCEIYRPTNLQGDIDNSDSYSNRLVLADGTIIGHVYLNNTACNTNWGSGALSQSCGSFKVDLNGSKKPNMYGKDIFQFVITANAIVPSGVATDTSGNNFDEACIKTNMRMNGVGCTGWVIYNENMDYLKCPEKLGWDKAKSCK